MKRWFKVGDIAYLNKNKRGMGFMIKADTPVEIAKVHSILAKGGSYMYDIIVVNPKTNEKVLLEGWVTQFDVVEPALYEELKRMRAENDRLLAELEKAQAKSEGK